ncbi:MAG: RnfABCDGE type electron transport complex subunit D [Candidatus Margulisiibacteriota bacterium]
MFQVSVSPHVRDKATTQGIMFGVIVALLPAVIVALLIFKLPAFVVVGTSIFTAIFTEAVINYLRKKPLTIFDGSALLTGLLLAMTLPPTTPWWAAALGAFVAIAIAKQAFGGLGMNIFNPALVGRAFLLASYPVILTTWVKPFSGITTASPLGIAKEAGPQAALAATSYIDSFLGVIPGSLGETSALALLIGGIFLLAFKIIDWRIPLSYIATVAVMAFLFKQDIPFHLLNGGLMIGAFFMATDYVTSPVTPWGRVVFGMGAGLITMVIRLWGGYPEGVCYSILLMNAVTPLLDKLRFQKDAYIS